MTKVEKEPQKLRPHEPQKTVPKAEDSDILLPDKIEGNLDDALGDSALDNKAGLLNPDLKPDDSQFLGASFDFLEEEPTKPKEKPYVTPYDAYMKSLGWERNKGIYFHGAVSAFFIQTEEGVRAYFLFGYRFLDPGIKDTKRGDYPRLDQSVQEARRYLKEHGLKAIGRVRHNKAPYLAMGYTVLADDEHIGAILEHALAVPGEIRDTLDRELSSPQKAANGQIGYLNAKIPLLMYFRTDRHNATAEASHPMVELAPEYEEPPAEKPYETTQAMPAKHRSLASRVTGVFSGIGHKANEFMTRHS